MQQNLWPQNAPYFYIYSLTVLSFTEHVLILLLLSTYNQAY